MLVKQEMSNIIDEHMMAYSAEVLLQRAIPVLQDGMKPVQRRILFTLHHYKVNQLTKSANITGNVQSIHPHGSSYGAMVNMTQQDRNQVPLITGHGSFGQFNSKDLEASAERYTEVKISDFGKEMTKQIDDHVVNFSKSYDGRLDLPDVIPVSFPLVLLYAQSGIGVGFASSTLSYNMNEIADAITNYIKNEETPILYPDFATRGYIIEDEDALENNTINGRSTFTLRGKVIKVNNYTLSITEVPYGVKREAIIDKVVSLYQQGKLPEVKNIKDLSDFKGQNIEITTKKSGVDLDVLTEKLYKLTPLESTISSNNNLIDINKGLPSVMGVEEIIKKWLEWRLSVIRIGLSREVDKLSKTVMLYEGLGKVLNRVDELIDVIRHTKKNDLLKVIGNKFNLNEEQSNYVINIRLYNINEGFIQDKLDEIDDIKQKLNDKQSVVDSDEKILSIISDEVQAIKNKYGEGRHTQIIKKPKVSKIVSKKVKNDLVSNHEIIITKNGNLFKDVKNKNSLVLEPGDEVIKSFITESTIKLQAIADDGNIHGIEVKKIPSNINKVGTNASSLIKNYPNVLLILTPDDEQVVYGYENGKVNVWPTSSINFSKNITKNAYDKDSKLIFSKSLSDNEEVGIGNSKDWKIYKVKDFKHSNSRIAKGTYTLSNHKLSVTYDEGEKNGK